MTDIRAIQLGGAVLGMAALLMGSSAYASADDAFAELREIPKSPAEALNLPGPPPLNPDRGSVLIVRRDGSEEMTVIGNRGTDWAGQRQLDKEEHARLFQKFGPVVQNYSEAFNSCVSLKILGVEISPAGIAVGPIRLGFGGPPPKEGACTK